MAIYGMRGENSGELAIETAMRIESMSPQMMRMAEPECTADCHAIIPNMICRWLFTSDKALRVLDFGCGKEQLHVKELVRAHGERHHIAGYDISLPETWRCLHQPWDIIYLSNVLNVQPDRKTLELTLAQLHYLWDINPKALIPANYPSSPRHGAWSLQQLLAILGDNGIMGGQMYEDDSSPVLMLVDLNHQ